MKNINTNKAYKKHKYLKWIVSPVYWLRVHLKNDPINKKLSWRGALNEKWKSKCKNWWCEKNKIKVLDKLQNFLQLWVEFSVI